MIWFVLGALSGAFGGGYVGWRWGQKVAKVAQVLRDDAVRIQNAVT